VTTSSVKPAMPWSARLSSALAAVLVLAALGWSYASSFRGLIDRWYTDPNHSYGFFVIPISLMILWNRRGLLDRARIAPSVWGLVPLLALLGLRVFLYEWNEQYVETATIPLVVASITLAVGGWHLLRVALPAIVFLFFMLPLPPSLNNVLSTPLQKLATLGSVALLQVLGYPVLAEGNVILVGADRLEVARACNGLSMLLTFVALITATVLLVARPLWERLVLLASAIPIALISNILRITATAWCYYHFGHEAGDKIAHDAAGLAMMPIALALIFLELKVMSWLFTEVEIEQVGSPGLAMKKSSGVVNG
jgi:exosortase